MKILLVIMVVLGSIGSMVGLSYGLGWIGVHQKKTIGKAMQNAERTVYEESQSYVEGKRQESVRLYKEYTRATDKDKETICEVVSLSFANFNLDYLKHPAKGFVHNCMF